MADPFELPFLEAIRFFRQKVRIPTARWDELQTGAHRKAFTVAGALTDDLLADFQAEIAKALEEGTGYSDFQKRFREIVRDRGWVHKGKAGWRSQVIWQTNMSTAYHAGRYAQMTDPDVLSYRPYWRYRHGGSRHPRPEHLRWDGLVLPADDPWWSTHYPPNGWGCRCYVEALSERDLARIGKAGPDKAPEEPVRRVRDRVTGDVSEVPWGIDPGWAYSPGRAWLEPAE